MDVLIGLQFGDEGKGKITDMLSEKYDIVARYQGGANAGHTIYYNGNKIVLHLIPSGIVHDHTNNFLGNGMVIDPYQLMIEIEEVEKYIPNARNRIFISENAHVVTPHNLIQDRENVKTIGSTSKGIGPCYKDKVYRKGYRVIDFIGTDLTIGPEEGQENTEEFNKFNRGVMFMNSLNIVKSNWLRKQNGKVLAEGAQGSMLDIDHGTYPYVTSSSTVSSGACVGLGMPPQSVDKVYGVFKSYVTRVGNGELKTELYDEIGEQIQKVGGEFGATTGRPRRCGWLNLDELRDSIELNGVTDLIMTKVDVLENMDEVKIFADDNYHRLNSWEKSSLDDDNLSEYINFIENNIDKKIDILSISPDREGVLKLF